MFTFAIDYCITVFMSAFGVMQLSFSLGGIKGLMLFGSDAVCRIFGIVLVVAGFVLFFSTGTRNINDYEGGLDAPTQGLLFFCSASVAVLATLILSSLVNRKMRGQVGNNDDHGADIEAGLDSLRDTNYALALWRGIISLWRKWR